MNLQIRSEFAHEDWETSAVEEIGLRTPVAAGLAHLGLLLPQTLGHVANGVGVAAQLLVCTRTVYYYLFGGKNLIVILRVLWQYGCAPLLTQKSMVPVQPVWP